MEKLSKRDTTMDEMRKTTAARDALDRQDVMVRRIIAGAYRVNAVYFFRNVDFQDTITLNPVDIVCALRPRTSKNITFTPDPSKWPTIATTSTPEAI